MADQYDPSVDTTIFPRINLIKDFSSRLAQRIANGRVAMFFKRAIGPIPLPSLDLNFAKNKTLGSKVTFTRASIATYVDANGVLQTAAPNTPRFDHDPVTGESLGLLIEESRRNKAQQSEDLSASSWEKISGATVTSSSVTAPDGVSNMWLVDLSNTAGTTSAGSRVYQSNLAFNSAVNTFSFMLGRCLVVDHFP